MASHLSFLVVLALTATAAVSAFDIVDSSSDSIMVKEGEDIELWCSTRWRSDDYWEWCDITHVASNRTWDKGLDNVKVGKCSDFADRFEYIGNKGAAVYKCGIRLKVRPEDAGEWKCDITGYYNGYNYTISPLRDVEEINPELTKVTWTSEKKTVEGEDKPLKGVEED